MDPVASLPPLAPQVTATEAVTGAPTFIPGAVTSPPVTGGAPGPLTSTFPVGIDVLAEVDRSRVNAVGDDPLFEKTSRYTIELRDYVSKFVGYLRTGGAIVRDCAASAEASRIQFTSERLHEVRGVLSGLRVYREPLHGRRNYVDVLHDPQRCDEALGYVALAINEGLPIVVGVNELGGVTLREDGSLANDGITDHYILIVGYEVSSSGAIWKIIRLQGMDNAPGPMPEHPAPADLSYRFPVINVERNGTGEIVRVLKPASSAGGAAGSEYQLTLVKVYERHVARIRDRVVASRWKL